ncbi:hypothetical protein VaNZ11_015561 [Volvox africanus]|uniref:Uncharacterized protein n=1 Tax=Volvox africanus TaxID=51714 RepID=A0ABQ5SMJ8_9CHLO|nr:hypothetical protein VaNZ11_015561 [Volvox africanus]
MKDPGMQSSPMLFGRKEYAVVKQAVLTQLKKKTCSKAIDSDEDRRDQVSEMAEERAYGIISEFLDPMDRPQYEECESAWDLWEAIRETYEQVTKASVMEIFHKLKNFKMLPNESIQA